MLTQSEQFFQQLKLAKNVAVVFNKNWSGDNVAAGLALAQLLIKQGYKITLAADPEDKQTLLSFLPLFPFIQPLLDGAKYFIINIDTLNTKIKDLKYHLTPDRLAIIIAPEYGSILPQQISTATDGFAYDAIIILGCPDLDSLGAVYTAQPELWSQTSLINLDCSPANEAYGQINLLNVKASSLSEIIYQLFANQTDLIDSDIATCLLAGIISATNNFKTPALSPQTMTTAAELLRLGARREEIIDQLYRSQKIATLKLWGAGLTNLNIGHQDKLAWTWFDYETIKKSQLKRRDLITIIEELIANLSNLEVVVMFIAKGDETTALVYSLKNFNALELTKNYQGQGTDKLAQVLIKQPLESATKELITALSQEL
ncbi:MAG: hypothetical protein PHW95_05645 [Patescibacteria group bacterium]|nr:hypothetical protein [Patescibacteria group bacterium]